MVSGVQNVSFLGEIPSADGSTRVVLVAPPRRKEDLPADTVEFSSKRQNKEEKGVLASTCETIGNGVKSFVNMTVNAFARAGSEVVVDKVVNSIAKK